MSALELAAVAQESHRSAQKSARGTFRKVAPEMNKYPYAKHLMEARHYTDDDFGHTDLPSARGLELFNTPREHAKNKMLMEIDQLESMGGRRAIL